MYEDSKFSLAIPVLFLCFCLFSCVSRPQTEIIENKTFIIIDAGHGGEDPGAVANYQINGETVIFNEKDFTLIMAKLLVADLYKRLPQAEIILTRSEDIDLSLEDRTNISNQASENFPKAIFISIHANNSPNNDAAGFEVYYHMPVLLDPEAYIDVQFLINKINNNAPLARAIINAVGSIPGLDDLPRSIKNDDFYVLRNTTATSVLIECGYLSNEHEALLLNSTIYQEKLAEGIALGIVDFVENR